MHVLLFRQPCWPAECRQTKVCLHLLASKANRGLLCIYIYIYNMLRFLGSRLRDLAPLNPYKPFFPLHLARRSRRPRPESGSRVEGGGAPAQRIEKSDEILDYGRDLMSPPRRRKRRRALPARKSRRLRPRRTPMGRRSLTEEETEEASEEASESEDREGVPEEEATASKQEAAASKADEEAAPSKAPETKVPSLDEHTEEWPSIPSKKRLEKS